MHGYFSSLTYVLNHQDRFVRSSTPYRLILRQKTSTAQIFVEQRVLLSGIPVEQRVLLSGIPLPVM
jgi:hypothetical protein